VSQLLLSTETNTTEHLKLKKCFSARQMPAMKLVNLIE